MSFLGTVSRDPTRRVRVMKLKFSTTTLTRADQTLVLVSSRDYLHQDEWLQRNVQV